MQEPIGGVAGVIIQIAPLLVVSGLIIPAYWKIFRRLGHSPWLSLLILVPLIGWIALPWLVAGMMDRQAGGRAATDVNAFR